MRLAFFTPLPPVQSAIADIGEGLGSAFTTLGADVDYVLDDAYTPDSPVVGDRGAVTGYRDFSSRVDAYDAILYSLGNHPHHHGYMYDSLRRHPGWVMLHDLALHPYVAEMTLGRYDRQAYLDVVEYAYGFRDFRIAKLMETPLADQCALDYPMFERIVDSSRGVILYNAYAAAEVSRRCPDANVACVPYPFFLPPGMTGEDAPDLRAKYRAMLGIGKDDLVVGSFGILVPDKHIETCLRAFKQMLQVRPDAHYVLGGPLFEGYDLPGFIATEGLSDHVHLTGWMPPRRFAEMMFALDVAIHLRYPHIGGTPYTPVRLMGLGVCTIVSDIAPLAEFPQGACVKVPTGGYQEEILTATLLQLAQTPDLVARIADNGRRYIATHHDIRATAAQHLEFISRGRAERLDGNDASPGR